MRARLGIDAHGLPRIELDGETVVDAMRTAVPAWEARNAECVSTPWEPIEGKDALGPFTGLRSVLVHEEERTIEQTLRDHGSAIVFTARFLRTVDGTGQADSFEQPSLHAPRFGLPDRSRVCLATHGLGASDDPFGGYWPTAHVCDGDALPSEAFAPMVVFREAGALAIAPFSHFLTGCLVATPHRVDPRPKSPDPLPRARPVVSVPPDRASDRVRARSGEVPRRDRRLGAARLASDRSPRLGARATERVRIRRRRRLGVRDDR